jgi:hypothetical protein
MASYWVIITTTMWYRHKNLHSRPMDHTCDPGNKPTYAVLTDSLYSCQKHTLQKDSLVNK